MMENMAHGLKRVHSRIMGLAMAVVLSCTALFATQAHSAEYGNGFKQIDLCYSLQRNNGSWTDVRHGTGAIFDGDSLMKTIKVSKSLDRAQLFLLIVNKRGNIVVDMHLYDGIPKTSILLHTISGEPIKVYRSLDNCPIKKL